MKSYLPDYPHICVPIRLRCLNEITYTHHMKLHITMKVLGRQQAAKAKMSNSFQSQCSFRPCLERINLNQSHLSGGSTSELLIAICCIFPWPLIHQTPASSVLWCGMKVSSFPGFCQAFNTSLVLLKSPFSCTEKLPTSQPLSCKHSKWLYVCVCVCTWYMCIHIYLFFYRTQSNISTDKRFLSSFVYVWICDGISRYVLATHFLVDYDLLALLQGIAN